jgi:hypothetical protein
MRPAPPPLSLEQRLEMGHRAAQGAMYRQDKIWSRFSNDKVDIAHVLTAVLRTLHKALPLDAPLTALSIGSSNEPQFRILEAACRGGLFLLDIEQAALEVIAERTARQTTDHVRTLHDDYRQVLRDAAAVDTFRERELGGQRLSLVTLHHSLYYSEASFWHELLANLYQRLLKPLPVAGASADAAGPVAAIHAVLMASRSDDRTTTTWLYNHFAEKFFDCRNEQDLLACAEQLRADPRFADAQVLTRTDRVEFFVDDFEQFMAVVWMILLHPTVHQYSLQQQREVIEWVYENLWSQGQPLIQLQDHLVIYRGRGIPGLL